MKPREIYICVSEEKNHSSKHENHDTFSFVFDKAGECKDSVKFREVVEINWDKIRDEMVEWCKLKTDPQGKFHGENLIGEIEKLVNKQLEG